MIIKEDNDCYDVEFDHMDCIIILVVLILLVAI